jgi:hypothetical protein
LKKTTSPASIFVSIKPLHVSISSFWWISGMIFTPLKMICKAKYPTCGTHSAARFRSWQIDWQSNSLNSSANAGVTSLSSNSPAKLRKRAWYVWVDGKETDQVSDSTEDALPRAKLIREKTLPARLLNSRASGVEVPLEYAEKLERLWSKHLKIPLKTSSLVIGGISALEGEPIEHRSYRRKRDQRLRRAALDASNGVCAVCDVDYSKVLNGKGARVLQAHHKRQLSQSDKPKLNTPADLAVVCANCHALIHMNPKKALTITSLRLMLRRS